MGFDPYAAPATNEFSKSGRTPVWPILPILPHTTAAANAIAAAASCGVICRRDNRHSERSRMDLPLTGIRVVELGSSVAAPYATWILAALGAEVIKVERPGTGDDARGWGEHVVDGERLWFHVLNANKRSIVVDLKDAAEKVAQQAGGELLRWQQVVEIVRSEWIADSVAQPSS